MNCLLEKGLLTEMECGNNFAYVLSDNNLFLPTEYKVLQSQAGNGFVKCMKMLFNGHVQLYYMVNALKPLSQMLPSMTAQDFIMVVTNLFADILAAKSTGFLSCQNVELSLDKIFIDPNTLKVSVIYLPVSKHLFDDFFSFENNLRANLVKLIDGMTNLSSMRTAQLATELTDGTVSLEDIYSFLKGGSGHSGSLTGKGGHGGGKIKMDDVTEEKVRVRIVAMNAPVRVELEVNKDRYVIGKNAAAVDGAVTFNKMISRVHCRIDRQGSRVTITDLQSANGTYVNKVRIQPNQAHPVKNGDIIRLANSDFQIQIQ